MPGAVSCRTHPSSPSSRELHDADPHPPKDFPHEHARSRTYRWGEDGIAGVCDTHGFQNLAFSFWNEKEYVQEPRP